MILSSYMKPVFIEIEDEPTDNLIAFNPEELRRKVYTSESDIEHVGVGQRLLESAIESIGQCNHNWGMAHFWKNPKMLPPCQVVKVDKVWYRRKDCSMIDLDDLEWS